MMQNVFRSRRPASVYPLVITAILLFALSGLMVGFAFGAVTRFRFPSFSQGKQTPIDSLTARPAPSATPGVRPLGCPDVTTNALQQKADGRTAYSAEVQAEDKYRNETCNLKGRQRPVHNEGLTCRLWLMDSSGKPHSLPEERIRAKQLEAPFPDETEVVGGLLFAAGTPQTQQCKQGKGTWQYTISSDVDDGTYYLMGLTSWNGQTYNWSWARITIQNDSRDSDPVDYEEARDAVRKHSETQLPDMPDLDEIKKLLTPTT